ncbi:MAG: ABC transporter substrate-binding protein, partial [Clostridiales bacterium]|nr:ABC transporter substrate-binding protein [Clostridiales bacterium]
MKRILAVLLVCALDMSLAACASASSNASTGVDASPTYNSDSGTSTGGDASAGDSSASLPPVVITYMVTGDVPTNKTTTDVLPAINKILGEKLNAELQVKWIEWTDYLSHYNLELASQDGNIDLVGTATDWLDAWPNVQKSAFMVLTEELLQTCAPQTWAQVPADNWELCKYDGEIYLIPEDNYAQWTNHGFMIRGDWAKEAGLADGVHSWAELGTYFQYIKDTYPDVIPWDAKPDASIVTQLSSGWLTSHTAGINIEGLRSELFFGESKDN